MEQRSIQTWTQRIDCDKGLIWNPSNCECDKSCDVAENLYYENCKCIKRLIDNLVEECIENIDEKNYIHL